MSTAVYLRVSTVQQEVLAQTVDVNRWLLGHQIENAKWYVDKCTGTTMKRPAFLELQQAIFNGEIRTVVMYSIDRFSRTMIDGLIKLDQWRKANVRLVFVIDCLDLQGTDPLNEVFVKLAISMRLAMAEHERERLRVRMQSGIEAAAKKQARAKELRKAGRTVDEIAAELTETVPRVEKMLKARGKIWWGGSLPGKQGRGLKADPYVAYELQRSGRPYKEIARILGVHKRIAQAYVARVRKERGERAPGRWKRVEPS